MRVLVIGDGDFSWSVSLVRALSVARKRARGYVENGKPGAADVVEDLTVDDDGNIAVNAQSVPRLKKRGYLQKLPTSQDVARYMGVERSVVEKEDWDVVCTCYDSYDRFLDLFPHGRKHVEFLKTDRRFPRTQVSFQIDATALSLAELGSPFDRICWNFPHTGREDADSQQRLIRGFLSAGQALLTKPSGLVVLSLLEGQWERWRLDSFIHSSIICSLSTPHVDAGNVRESEAFGVVSADSTVLNSWSYDRRRTSSRASIENSNARKRHRDARKIPHTDPHTKSHTESHSSSQTCCSQSCPDGEESGSCQFPGSIVYQLKPL